MVPPARDQSASARVCAPTWYSLAPGPVNRSSSSGPLRLRPMRLYVKEGQHGTRRKKHYLEPLVQVDESGILGSRLHAGCHCPFRIVVVVFDGGGSPEATGLNFLVGMGVGGCGRVELGVS